MSANEKSKTGRVWPDHGGTGVEFTVVETGYGLEVRASRRGIFLGAAGLDAFDGKLRAIIDPPDGYVFASEGPAHPKIHPLVAFDEAGVVATLPLSGLEKHGD